jgi:hypothetical protein
MKCRLFALTTLLATISFTSPVTAQFNNPSQDFFEQGRDRLEREIETLQQESLDWELTPQDAGSKPLLEASPSPAPASNSSQPSNETQTSDQQPNEANPPSQQLNSD